jgi:hypothetical protein
LTRSHKIRHDSRTPRPSDALNLSILLLLCGILAWLRWARLDELLWGDPVHWLHEVSRVAQGELPYRDFSFQYPPFTAFFFGWMFRAFGTTFRVASLLINFWSFATVLLCYTLTKYLLPPAMRLPTCFLLIAVGATSLTNFNLFSYRIYSPSLETGAVGTMLALLGILRLLENKGSESVSLSAVGIGSTIALLSKPEFALAAICALFLFATLNQRGWWNVKLLAIAILPSVALYLGLARIVGRHNMMAGISGYGLATFACPWWPTGLGVFGVASALGEALLIATVISFPWRRDFETWYGSAYHRVRWLSIPGVLIFMAYVVTMNRQALASSRSVMDKAMQILPSLLWTAPVLLPVMWTTIVLFGWLTLRWLRDRPGFGHRNAVLLLILILPVSMSPRTWFGSTQGVTADIAASCYPFLLILGPYLLWRFLSAPSARIPATAIVGSLAVLYGLARLVGGATLFTQQSYRDLETAAGKVSISDFSPGIPIYGYIAAHTAPSEEVLELPYGGGLNFASGRRNPIFDTMLFNMEIPSEFQQRDLDRMEQRKPKLVIGADVPRLGMNYSFGIPGDRACVCPRLVWAPDRPSWNPDYIYPLAGYLEAHYHAVWRGGGKVILERNPDLTASRPAEQLH